jgi:flagellar hook-length control protein FliK
LFQKVQSPSWTQVKNALQVSYGLDKAGENTYDFLTNSMAAEAASLPNHAPNCQASGVDRHTTVGSAPTSGIKGANGDIFTGFYKNFQSLSDDEKQASSMRGSASTSTPRRVVVVIPKRARQAPSKLTRNSIKDDQGKFFYEGQAQGRRKVQESIQLDQGPPSGGSFAGGGIGIFHGLGRHGQLFGC